MTFLDAAILGLVEGITEFLPISSTGHLIVAGQLLGLPSSEVLKSFDIAIQSGAILAAAILFSRTLLTDRRALLLAMIGFIPTGIVGVLLHGVVKEYLFSVPVVTTALFLGGIALIAFEVALSKKTPTVIAVQKITVRQALLIGLAQSIALIPGASRSAMTIMAGMLLGIGRATIVEYSFLLALPTMAAATVYDLLKSSASFSAADGFLIATGFVASFLTALVAIRWLLHYVRSHTFIAFGVYRIIVAMVLWGFVAG